MTLFSELNQQQILALAISSEDDDARIYMSFANRLHDDFPASAHVFIEMAEEEHEHRRLLQELYVKKFGDHIPLIRRADISDFIKNGKLRHIAQSQNSPVPNLQIGNGRLLTA